MQICRICGEEGEHPAFTPREMMFGLGDMHPYFQCAKCGCLQIATIPADMQRYYPQSYYSYGPERKKSWLRESAGRLKTLVTLYGGSIADTLFSGLFWAPVRAVAHLNIGPNCRILDVGCGSGVLLRLLARAGFRNICGVDPYIEKDLDIGEGIKILKRRLSDMVGEWDVIMYHHSLEHISDQYGEMAAVYRLLTPGGRCLIRTPTVSSFAWKHYGTNWVQLDAPRHFFLHSVDSLSLLAERSGLRLDRVEYDSTAFQFWGSELYRKGISLVNESRDGLATRDAHFSRKDIRRFSLQAKERNRDREGDEAAFYLTKCSIQNDRCE